MNLVRTVGSTFVTALIVACGGGGSDSNTSTPTPTPVPPIVLQASAGDLSKYANTNFRSDCGTGVVGVTLYSGYATFSFGAATTATVSGVYNFAPAGIVSCTGGSNVPPQTINYTMTYAGTTTVSSSDSTASGVADVFAFKDNVTNRVNTQTFAFDSTFVRLYVSDQRALFTNRTLAHMR
jgi:hypothetical protein